MSKLLKENIQLTKELDIAIKCLSELNPSRSKQEWCNYLIEKAEKEIDLEMEELPCPVCGEENVYSDSDAFCESCKSEIHTCPHCEASWVDNIYGDRCPECGWEGDYGE